MSGTILRVRLEGKDAVAGVGGDCRLFLVSKAAHVDKFETRVECTVLLELHLECLRFAYWGIPKFKEFIDSFCPLQEVTLVCF